jgi:hypothetical protein
VRLLARCLSVPRNPLFPGISRPFRNGLSALHTKADATGGSRRLYRGRGTIGESKLKPVAGSSETALPVRSP